MNKISDILGYQSPFLDYNGFKNRPTDDLKDILNQDAELSNEEILQLIADGEIEIKRFLTFIDNNKNKVYDEGDDLKYKTVIFTSRDAILLKKAYQSVTPNPEQILVFIEDNTGDISSQKHYIKIGDIVRKNLENNIDFVDFSDHFKIYNIGDGDDDKEIHELIKKQFTELSNFDKFKSVLYTVILINQNNFKSINDFAITILDYIIEGIEGLKIESHHWNKEKNTQGEFIPIFFPFVNETNTKSFKENVNRNLLHYKENIKNAVNKGFNVHYTSLLMPGGPVLYIASKDLIAGYKNQTLDYIDRIFDDINPVLDEFVDYFKNGIYFVNALLCGLINSIIEAVAGIFQIIKLVFKLANNLGSLFLNNDELIEKLDNAVQAFREINFSKIFSSVKLALSEIWETIKTTWKDLSFDLSVEEIGYFIGYCVGFILEIIVGILFTGGIASVKAIFQKIFIKSKKLIDDIIEIVSRQFSKFTKAVSKDLFSQLTDFLKKGTDNFLKLIREIKEHILRFFNKNTVSNRLIKSRAFKKGWDIDRVLAYDKLKRPLPSTYLTKKYIREHKELFEKEGIASRIVSKERFDKYGVGKPDKGKTEFVSRKSDMDAILNLPIDEQAKKLGISINDIKSGNIIRIDFKISKECKIQIPSGNEYATNEKWLPGGVLPDGHLEAIIKTEGLKENIHYIIKSLNK